MSIPLLTGGLSSHGQYFHIFTTTTAVTSKLSANTVLLLRQKWFEAQNSPSVCFFDITLLLYSYLTFPQQCRENIYFFVVLTFLYLFPLFCPTALIYLTFGLPCSFVCIFQLFNYS